MKNNSFRRLIFPQSGVLLLPLRVVNTTELSKMENSLFGIVIQVSNLELCKAFYRDVLGLGAPVMDSTFWVEFKLDDHASLFLEKSEVLDTSGKRGHISWIYRADNLDDLKEMLVSYGYITQKVATDLVGFSVYRLHDPEGNPFFIAPKKPESLKNGNDKETEL